jgi:hypothetical protein
MHTYNTCTNGVAVHPVSTARTVIGTQSCALHALVGGQTEAAALGGAAWVARLDRFPVARGIIPWREIGAHARRRD